MCSLKAPLSAQCSWVCRLIAPMIMRWSGAMHHIAGAICTEIENRVAEGHNSPDTTSNRVRIETTFFFFLFFFFVASQLTDGRQARLHPMGDGIFQNPRTKDSTQNDATNVWYSVCVCAPDVHGQHYSISPAILILTPYCRLSCMPYSTCVSTPNTSNLFEKRSSLSAASLSPRTSSTTCLYWIAFCANPLG